MENRFPKNVRQIGNVSDTPKIYVEDYVDTFLNQLCENAEETPIGIFLIGHTIRQEEQDCIYISGAIRMRESEEKRIEITKDSWEEAQKEKDEFFPDGTIIGWCFVQKEGILPFCNEMKYIHEQYFTEFGSVLILKTAEEEQYFAYKYKELMSMNGHYVYYEKNTAMQNYMILERKKIGVTPSEDVEDKAAKEFRNIVKERIIIREEKKHSKFLRVASVLLVLVVMGMGVTTLNNYGKMQALQGSIEYIKDSVIGNQEIPDQQPVSANAELIEKEEEEPVEPEEEEPMVEEPSEEPEDTLMTSTVQEMSEDVYIVEKGDTLVKISRKVYGDSGHVDAICRMNGLSDGNLIFIGQKLLLP